MDGFAEAFVDKLILLEEVAGATVPYQPMPQQTGSLGDAVSIQLAAKQIADFAGLTDWVFVVSVAKQGAGTSGHIELGRGKREVFIEIDPSVLEFNPAVAATLCHEICHKWLETKCIQSSTERDNEIFTDISTIFLGFGKIMLNGCSTSRTSRVVSAGGGEELTRTFRVGYLERDQLAFVYRLVCAMRHIPSGQMLDGLNPDATRALERCDTSFGHYYSTRFHDQETTKIAAEALAASFLRAQLRLSELTKQLAYTRKSFCGTIEAYIRDQHYRVQSLRKSVDDIAERSYADPALRFLRSIKSEAELTRVGHTTDSIADQTQVLADQAALVNTEIYKHKRLFPVPGANVFTIVSCPNDGTRLRVPNHSRDLVVSCPRCKYRFGYNSTPPSFDDQVSHVRSASKSRRGWARRMWRRLFTKL